MCGGVKRDKERTSHWLRDTNRSCVQGEDVTELLADGTAPLPFPQAQGPSLNIFHWKATPLPTLCPRVQFPKVLFCFSPMSLLSLSKNFSFYFLPRKSEEIQNIFLFQVIKTWERKKERRKGEKTDFNSPSAGVLIQNSETQISRPVHESWYWHLRYLLCLDSNWRGKFQIFFSMHRDKPQIIVSICLSMLLFWEGFRGGKHLSSKYPVYRMSDCLLLFSSLPYPEKSQAAAVLQAWGNVHHQALRTPASFMLHSPRCRRPNHAAPLPSLTCTAQLTLIQSPLNLKGNSCLSFKFISQL